MKHLNIALVGAGYAAFLHVNGYAHVGGVSFTLHTICDVIPEKAESLKEEYGFLYAETDYDKVVANPEIDVIDIVTPPFLHIPMIEKALKAGKSVICEKPLTGYFGREGDPEPIGDKVPKGVMYEAVLEDLAAIQKVAGENAGHFYYAENFVFAPAVRKLAEIVTLKKSRILSMRCVIALKGSSSPLAGSWAATGGGMWARNGVHPLGCVLWLKKMEGLAKGEDIRPVAVVADMGRTTEILSEDEHKYISARPIDVEDHAVVTVTFSDTTKAVIYAADTCLGGSRNYINVYCNDGAYEAKLTDNDLLHSYLLDEDGLEGYSLGEMLPSKLGWNKAFVSDDTIRGYVGEFQDFLTAAAEGRDSDSGFDLAYETSKVLYAAYLSAEQGKRVEL